MLIEIQLRRYVFSKIYQANRIYNRRNWRVRMHGGSFDEFEYLAFEMLSNNIIKIRHKIYVNLRVAGETF